ncbi:hypothetical protein CYMTET_14136 [Cymbomonas tetramitiformis]|uniref:Uncharacterized protein n=1 Tax=Cymbomonas tetramitiformis TaxID=36881 RepID=A0AAE0GH28_9CHLO|nr:hypothetical protein CYMTET_14136 [Cymbomonas tetramitiformis]
MAPTTSPVTSSPTAPPTTQFQTGAPVTTSPVTSPPTLAPTAPPTTATPTATFHPTAAPSEQWRVVRKESEGYASSCGDLILELYLSEVPELNVAYCKDRCLGMDGDDGSARCSVMQYQSRTGTCQFRACDMCFKTDYLESCSLVEGPGFTIFTILGTSSPPPPSPFPTPSPASSASTPAPHLCSFSNSNNGHAHYQRWADCSSHGSPHHDPPRNIFADPKPHRSPEYRRTNHCGAECVAHCAAEYLNSDNCCTDHHDAYHHPPHNWHPHSGAILNADCTDVHPRPDFASDC